LAPHTAGSSSFVEWRAGRPWLYVASLISLCGTWASSAFGSYAAINGLQLAQFTYVADRIAVYDQQIGITPRGNAAEACWRRYRAATDVTAPIAAIEPIASANSSISRNRAKPGGG
jgi:hypothetical protein